MARKVITTLATFAAAAVVLSLSACVPTAHQSAVQTAQQHPTASHPSGAATPPASASPAPVPVARLSTTPGDELLTLSGTGRSSDGSSVAVAFTVHAPVAWNSPAGAATLAAIAAAGPTQAAVPSNDLRDVAWDAANAASLAVVDYSATMVAGSWHPGERVEIDLGPGDSEVAVSATRLELEDGWWLITGPGSGHFVIAFKNNDSSTPDPSAWGNELETYGWGSPRVSGGTAASYEFDCRLDITPLGRESDGVAGWFLPEPGQCSAGIGD